MKKEKQGKRMRRSKGKKHGKRKGKQRGKRHNIKGYLIFFPQHPQIYTKYKRNIKRGRVDILIFEEKFLQKVKTLYSSGYRDFLQLQGICRG